MNYAIDFLDGVARGMALGAVIIFAYVFYDEAIRYIRQWRNDLRVRKHNAKVKNKQ